MNTKCSAKVRKVLFSDETCCASCTSAHQSESLQHFKSKCDDHCGIRFPAAVSQMWSNHGQTVPINRLVKTNWWNIPPNFDYSFCSDNQNFRFRSTREQNALTFVLIQTTEKSSHGTTSPTQQYPLLFPKHPLCVFQLNINHLCNPVT